MLKSASFSQMISCANFCKPNHCEITLATLAAFLLNWNAKRMQCRTCSLSEATVCPSVAWRLCYPWFESVDARLKIIGRIGGYPNLKCFSRSPERSKKLICTIYIYIFVISRLLFEIGRCFSAIANEADSTFEFYFKWDSISIVFRSDVWSDVTAEVVYIFQ